jgi:hypothetical protein
MCFGEFTLKSTDLGVFLARRSGSSAGIDLGLAAPPSQ